MSFISNQGIIASWSGLGGAGSLTMNATNVSPPVNTGVAEKVVFTVAMRFGGVTQYNVKILLQNKNYFNLNPADGLAGPIFPPAKAVLSTMGGDSEDTVQWVELASRYLTSVAYPANIPLLSVSQQADSGAGILNLVQEYQADFGTRPDIIQVSGPLAGAVLVEVDAVGVIDAGSVFTVSMDCF